METTVTNSNFVEKSAKDEYDMTFELLERIYITWYSVTRTPNLPVNASFALFDYISFEG